MLAFPSLAWFEELARLMNANEADFKRFGAADVTWGVAIQSPSSGQPPHIYRMVFEDYSCTSVTDVSPDATDDMSFVLQATHATWKEMVENIQAHDGPDLEHSLNRLALMDDPIYIAANDFLERDLFARYGQTFQLFFNGAVHIPTSFSG